MTLVPRCSDGGPDWPFAYRAVLSALQRVCSADDDALPPAVQPHHRDGRTCLVNPIETVISPPPKQARAARPSCNHQTSPSSYSTFLPKSRPSDPQSPLFLSRLPDNHVSAVDDGSARQQTRCYTSMDVSPARGSQQEKLPDSATEQSMPSMQQKPSGSLLVSA